MEVYEKMKMKNNKAAIELSIGTIVIVVLAMSMLILGIMLVRSIFSGSEEAVSSINQGVINEINKLFTNDNAKLSVFPATRMISMKQGTSEKGFAFSVRNNDINEQRFTWSVETDPNFNIQQKCGISASEANSWILVNSGSMVLGGSQKLDLPVLVTYEVPESAPVCTIQYLLTVNKAGEGVYTQTSVQLKILAA